jgi:hypothetical protein
MTLRTLGAAAVGAVIAALCLWAIQGQAEPKSQIEQIQVGRG